MSGSRPTSTADGAAPGDVTPMYASSPSSSAFASIPEEASCDPPAEPSRSGRAQRMAYASSVVLVGPQQRPPPSPIRTASYQSFPFVAPASDTQAAAEPSSAETEPRLRFPRSLTLPSQRSLNGGSRRYIIDDTPGSARSIGRGSIGRRFLARSSKVFSAGPRTAWTTNREYDPKTYLDDERLGGGNGIRVWYESYTTIDWIHDAIKDNSRLRRIRRLRGLRGFAINAWDRLQGWLVVTLVGLITAFIAAGIVESEAVLFDLKDGYCARDWRLAKRFCCPYGGGGDWDNGAGWGLLAQKAAWASASQDKLTKGALTGMGGKMLMGWAAPVASSPAWTALAHKAGEDENCPGWVTWAQRFGVQGEESWFARYGMYVSVAIVLASIASLLTLYLTSSELYVSKKDPRLGPASTAASKTAPLSTAEDADDDASVTEPDADTNGSAILSTPGQPASERTPLLGNGTVKDQPGTAALPRKVLSAIAEEARSKQALAPRKVLYFGSGSGISEIKVILSGFVIHGYLGFWTLFTKSVGLTLSVASGLSLGKEGPFVHIASCVGNIVSRIFPKFETNESKRREIISCACAAGVAVAFGAPVGGVLFSLEEVSYYFPAKVMFRSFFCAMVAAATLRFLDPFGTGKIVLFEVSYDKDWHFYELVFFVLIGLFGGLYGAYFTKLNMAWSKRVRAKTWMAKHPLWEVIMITVLSALVSYLNEYTRMGGPELIADLFSECRAHESLAGLCISNAGEIRPLVTAIASAMIAKALLTIVTFGIKLPAGIFIPTLAVGACFGRIVGLLVQYVQWTQPDLAFFEWCPASDSACIVPGVYAVVGAAAALAGVTRTTVSLVVIMFELTGTLTYAVPVMLGVLVARTVADALEHEGIYDLVLRFSGLPYLDAKKEYTWDGVSTLDAMDTGIEVIALDADNTVQSLRQKLDRLAFGSGYTDGGFPIVVRAGGHADGSGRPERIAEHLSLPASPVRSFHGANTPVGWRMVGYIAAQELEHGLSSIALQDLSADPATTRCTFRYLPRADEDGGLRDSTTIPTDEPEDLSIFVDKAPITVNTATPLELVHQYFVRLGVRYLVVLGDDGGLRGVIFKKRWLAFLESLESGGAH